MSRVTIVDYGIGNIASVQRAFRACGAEIEMATDPAQVAGADRLVVPGVGAFGDCVGTLRRLGFEPALLDHAASGRPYLGICVGMQMLFEVSEEFGEHRGLGLIPGRVVHIDPRHADGRVRKTPHIGWNYLLAPPGAEWSGTVLEGVPVGSTAYFVHSFTGVPAEERHRLADTDHEGYRVSAAVRSENVYGVQFHPEKSGPLGLSIVRRFLSLG